MTNLLNVSWAEIDSAELRIVLDRCFGGPGQYAGGLEDSSNLHLPLADATSRIILVFREGRIRSIEPGPAFDPVEWERVARDIESLLGVDAAFTIGKVTAFSAR